MLKGMMMKLLYQLNDRPPVGISALLALQHMLASIGGIVAVPLIVGASIGMSAADVVSLVSAALLVSGIFTMVQCLGVGPVGIKLPVVMGCSFAFLGIAISIGKTDGIAGILGSALVGGILVIVASFFMGHIRKLFPTHVSGVVVTLIGLTILPVSMNWIGDAPIGSDEFATLPKLLLAGITLLSVIIISAFGKGSISASAIVISMAIGYAAAFVMGMVDFTQIQTTPWFTGPEPFKHGLTFSLPAIISMCIAYIVIIAEATGNYMALATNCHTKIEGKNLRRGVLGDGIGSTVGAIFTSMPLASFSQNVGIVGLTGVASRFVVAITGLLMLLAGLFPKFGALAVTIPKPVLGGVGVVMFGMIAYSGIRMLANSADSRKNSLIICVSLAVGLGITFKPELLQNLPHDIAQLFHSGITSGTIVAVLMNLLLPNSLAADKQTTQQNKNTEQSQTLIQAIDVVPKTVVNNMTAKLADKINHSNNKVTSHQN